ncbi:MAG: hypothetical protein V5B30_14105 [Candidatus Accumulibacter delftensis]
MLESLSLPRGPRKQLYRRPLPLIVSARDSAALQAAARDLAAFLTEQPASALVRHRL